MPKRLDMKVVMGSCVNAGPAESISIVAMMILLIYQKYNPSTPKRIVYPFILMDYPTIQTQA
ncbi:MAG: hypothetical protein BGO55_12335 [Sphingobacteriales bacterium 50-39]|nr:MAG: hypothetical protein BGO55_12335 [Sphingobacteriales bacterium 50-39]